MGDAAWFVIAVILFIIAIIYASKLEKKRALNRSIVAEQLGFRYEKTPATSHYNGYRYFNLFSIGRWQETKYLLAHQSEEKDSEIFDYEYNSQSSNNSKLSRFTVVSFSSLNYRFPDFELTKEDILYRIASVIGYQDIDFESHPEFSEKYLLRGTKVDLIRKLFSSELMTYLENGEPISMEAKGSKVIFYREEWCLEVEEIISFYKQAEKVYSEFCKALNYTS